ncbi:uncharacterized protein BDZ99DRAFT_514047 [Mytilinidion resinicola]|uniref:F-box domain-containing protein n=1 Tax=Mytilinidion resinicola TaxID=574789 RepID=A0A6A6Z9M9_9PEZI|nr:uncharacterized protein BDZ99DRAFT_514047 [Mytilinidion resinicola]KAF2817832.1 hypothetical protein BDZ99DRAFT_514047 [Mytilinidion resinicola]
MAPKPPLGRGLIDFLAEPNVHWPIFESITSQLDVCDFIKLRRVSKSLSNVYETVQKSQWNINEALTKSVKDPPALRSKLGQASGVISGQFALKFLDRHVVGDRLDVFVHGRMEGMANVEFMAWAIEREGYAVTRSYSHDEERSKGTVEDKQYKTDVYQRPGSNSPSIYLQHTRETPIVNLLSTGCQGTIALSNFITPNKVYAPFAKETFYEHRAYLHGPLKDDFGEYLKAVAKTGRRILGIRWKDQHKSPHKMRKLTDGHMWSMALDSTNVAAPVTPSFVTDATTFKF